MGGVHPLIKLKKSYQGAPVRRIVTAVKDDKVFLGVSK